MLSAGRVLSGYPIHRLLPLFNSEFKSPCLDHVERSVSEHGASTGESSEKSDDEFRNGFLRIAFAVPILEGLHHVEPNGLVAPLLHDGRCNTF